MATQIQLRRGTAAEWADANPVLADGEAAWETDTARLKIGDGVTVYNDLEYRFETGGGGGSGDDGWSPVFNIASDGTSNALQISDWVGGSGTMPPVGQYVGAAGLVDDFADAANVRGQQGIQGIQGNTGNNGSNGFNGWAPLLAVQADGARSVLRVVGWAGGSGTAPSSGAYLGNTGLVTNIAQAIDIRGATGAGATPAGPAGAVQYQNGGSLAGSADFVFVEGGGNELRLGNTDDANGVLVLGGERVNGGGVSQIIARAIAADIFANGFRLLRLDGDVGTVLLGAIDGDFNGAVIGASNEENRNFMNAPNGTNDLEAYGVRLRIGNADGAGFGVLQFRDENGDFYNFPRYAPAQSGQVMGVVDINTRQLGFVDVAPKSDALNGTGARGAMPFFGDRNDSSTLYNTTALYDLARNTFLFGEIDYDPAEGDDDNVACTMDFTRGLFRVSQWTRPPASFTGTGTATLDIKGHFTDFSNDDGSSYEIRITDDQRSLGVSLRQGVFNIGDVVTGRNSGISGTVAYVTGFYIYLKNCPGGFEIDEMLDVVDQASNPTSATGRVDEDFAVKGFNWVCNRSDSPDPLGQNDVPAALVGNFYLLCNGVGISFTDIENAQPNDLWTFSPMAPENFAMFSKYKQILGDNGNRLELNRQDRFLKLRLDGSDVFSVEPFNEDFGSMIRTVVQRIQTDETSLGFWVNAGNDRLIQLYGNTGSVRLGDIQKNFGRHSVLIDNDEATTHYLYDYDGADKYCYSFGAGYVYMAPLNQSDGTQAALFSLGNDGTNIFACLGDASAARAYVDKVANNAGLYTGAGANNYVRVNGTTNITAAMGGTVLMTLATGAQAIGQGLLLNDAGVSYRLGQSGYARFTVAGTSYSFTNGDVRLLSNSNEFTAGASGSAAVVMSFNMSSKVYRFGSANDFNATHIEIDDGIKQIKLRGGVIHNSVTYNGTGTATFAVDGSDYYIDVDTTSLAATYTLPATPIPGRTIVFSDATGNALVNNITIKKSDGTTLYTINTNNGSVSIHAGGAAGKWIIHGKVV